MAEVIDQSVAIRVSFEAYLSSDHLSPATGKTIAVTISKNGGAFGNPSAGATNASEIGSGSYYVDFSTTDTGTVGPIVLMGTSSGVDTVKAHYRVRVPDATAVQIRQEMDSNSTKLANLDATISSRLASGSYTTPPTVTAIRTEMDSNSTKLANLDVVLSTRLASSGYTVPPTVTQIRTEMDSNSNKLANLDATVSSRLASGSYTAPDNTSITAIKAKTDNLPSDPADASDIASSFSTVNSTLSTIAGYVDTEVAAIKAKTDNLPASPAATGDIPTAAQIRAEMDSNSAKLANLDAAVSTRSTYAGGDTAGTTTLLGRLTSGRAGNLDNLDVLLSTRLAASGYTAPPTAAQNAAGLLDLVDGVEADYTVRGTLRIMLAASAGKLSGAATTNVLIRDVNDTKDRIDATVDTDGNRTAVTLDAS